VGADILCGRGYEYKEELVVGRGCRGRDRSGVLLNGEDGVCGVVFVGEGYRIKEMGFDF